MKFPIKALFNRIKKRRSSGNFPKHEGGCTDPNASSSQDISNHRENGSKNGSQPFPSNDFTLPAESSINTLGDELSASCASEANRPSSEHCQISRIKSSCQQRQALEPIASESKLEIEDELQAADQAPAIDNMENHDLQSSAIADMIAESPENSKAYELVPVLEQTKLPRGGVSIETKAVGRVQVRRDEERCERPSDMMTQSN
jgi:hypothetical protein